MDTLRNTNHLPVRIEISYKTILFTILFLLSLWLLVQIREIIFLVYVSFILMSAFKPMVEKLEKLLLPRIAAILIIYILIIGLIVFIATVFVPPFVSQSIRLGENIPKYLKQIIPFINIDSQTIVQQLTPISQNLFHVTVGVFTNIISFFTILVISFYLLIERMYLEKFLEGFVGMEGSSKLLFILHKIEMRLGAWVRGQLTLALVIGFATYLGLSILGIPYLLPLAIIAGILEIVPTIGPIISAIPAIIVALTISPVMALMVTVLYFIIQQLENQLVVPLVMKTVVGVAPLITLIALLIGAKLSGVEGALLSIPVVVTLQTVISEYSKLKS